MVEIDSGFIGDFKLGDNINRNLSLLAALYIAREQTANGSHRRALCKPICVTSISIIEALLHDLHFKARTFTREGVPGLVNSVAEYIRSKKLDKMDHLLTSAKKHDLLNADEAFYEELDYLRLVRNRVHIQNHPPKLDRDEHNVFTNEAVIRAEKALERVMRTMSKAHRRPNHCANHVSPFQLPWEPHYDADTFQPVRTSSAA